MVSWKLDLGLFYVASAAASFAYPLVHYSHVFGWPELLELATKGSFCHGLRDGYVKVWCIDLDHDLGQPFFYVVLIIPGFGGLTCPAVYGAGEGVVVGSKGVAVVIVGGGHRPGVHKVGIGGI